MSVCITSFEVRKQQLRALCFFFYLAKKSLFLLFSKDCVLCFCCHSQEMRGNLEDQKNKEPAYISTWIKASKCFYSHQDSASHQASSTYHLIVPQCIREMTDDQTIQQRQIEPKYFKMLLQDVIKCPSYLPRQGIPLQGLDNNDNLTQILYLLRTKNYSITKHL